MESPRLPDSRDVLRSIRPWVRRTPLLPIGEEGPQGVESDGTGAFLKLESLQVTGSFKVRGAAAALLELSPEARARGVITSSSGNHGRAVAWMASRLGIPATVHLPRWTDPSKVAAIRSLGAETRVEGDSYDEAEALGRKAAGERGLVWVDPFDDPWVIAGQGTVGVELLEQLPGVGTALVPLSGGGLAAGVAVALKAARPDIRVIGVSARRARTLWESLRHGAPLTLEEEETLATALAGGIGSDNRWTFPLVGRWVDAHILVEEEEIAAAMAWAYRRLKLVVEGGGAVAMAALLARLPSRNRIPGPEPVVAVVSGGNVDPAVLQRVLGDGRPSVEAEDDHP